MQILRSKRKIEARSRMMGIVGWKDKKGELTPSSRRQIAATSEMEESYEVEV
jgi:hypothetical protein